jgi:molybdate transport system permease protein
MINKLLFCVLIFLVSLVVLFLMAPLAHLAFYSPWAGVVQALTAPALRDALSLSLWTSTVSTALVVVLGGALAFVLVRCEFRGKLILDTLVDLPMVLPPMVVGLALLMLFGGTGWAGAALSQNGWALTFTPAAVVMAQVFVSLPYFVRAAHAGLEGADARLEAASALLGASEWRTFFGVTLPLMWPTVLAGAVLAWARSLGEFGATMVFAGNFQGRTQTMPLAIFSALQDNIQLAIALAVVLMGVSFALVLLLKWVVRRGRHV